MCLAGEGIAADGLAQRRPRSRLEVMIDNGLEITRPDLGGDTLLGDLNVDGAISAADLAVLLADWTG